MSDTQNKRESLYSLLGDLPDRNRPIEIEIVSIETRDDYILETLVLDLNGIERVPAYMVRPLEQNGPVPCVIYNHAHGGDYVLGKNELIDGRSHLKNPPYAVALAKEGYAVLAIDHWNFGERRGRTESALFKELLWKGQVLWGLMVYDSLRAVDYVCSRNDIDSSRIATLGLSMGSSMAWWLAALDERIRVCVDLCCLTDFDSLVQAHGLDGHGLYYYVPSLLKYFDTFSINALIAPRAHLSINGNLDPLTPSAGLDKLEALLGELYCSLNAADNWHMQRYETGHYETMHARFLILKFLREKL